METADMTDVDLEGLSTLGARACVLSKAYQLRREAFWWSNLVTLVLPAILSTAAAIVAAIPLEKLEPNPGIPPESVLAGLAAVLIAAHKAMKCEEYQAECLRLIGAYGSIAVDAQAVGRSSRNLGEEHSRLSKKITGVIENATATVPEKYVIRAKKICERDGYA